MKEEVEQLRERAKDERKTIKRLFNTVDGQEVMKILEREFYDSSSIVPGDPYATHARCGSREVIIFIKMICGEEK